MDKKGFSKREKRLLIFLFVFAITAAMVVLVIIPLYENIEDNRAEIGTLEFERMRVEVLLASEQSLRESHEEAQRIYLNARARYLAESHVSEIGRMLTRICLEHNLEPIEQRLSPAEASEHGDAFLVVTAAMMVRGTYDDLKSLIDTVEEVEYLRISRIALTLGGDGRYIESIGISFEVAMLRDTYMGVDITY